MVLFASIETTAFAAVEFEVLTLGDGESMLETAVIDPSHGFAYFGTYTAPGVVVKVRLSGFYRVGALTLQAGEDRLTAAVVDSEAGFAYFGTATARVVRINLSDFSRNASLTLDGPVTTALMDSARGFAYFGVMYGVTGKIVKVRLSDFSVVGATTTVWRHDLGETNLGPPVAAVIDTERGLGYFGTKTSEFDFLPFVVRLRLSDLAIETAGPLPPELGVPKVLVFDPYRNFVYAVGGDNPFASLLLKIDLTRGPASEVGRLYIQEGYVASALIDLAGLVYVAVSSPPSTGSVGYVIPVGPDLGRRGILATQEAGFSSAAVIDNGYAYFGVLTDPAAIMRISSSPPAASGFIITAHPDHLSVQSGSSISTILTVESFGAFYGNVSLSSSVAPSGPTAYMAPTTLGLALGTTESSSLTITVDNTVEDRTYDITITGTSENLTNSVSIQLNVLRGTIIGFQSYVLYGVVGVSIGIALASILWALRRKKTRQAVQAKLVAQCQ